MCVLEAHTNTTNAPLPLQQCARNPFKTDSMMCPVVVSTERFAPRKHPAPCLRDVYIQFHVVVAASAGVDVSCCPLLLPEILCLASCVCSGSLSCVDMESRHIHTHLPGGHSTRTSRESTKKQMLLDQCPARKVRVESSSVFGVFKRGFIVELFS